jgi:cytochrome c
MEMAGSMQIPMQDSPSFNIIPETGLHRITGIAVEETSGALPFTVNARAKVEDPENDPLVFVWDMGNGEIIESKEPHISYTYKEVGDYDITLTVSDPGKLSATSQPLSVYAGNIAPDIQIKILGNQTFYFPDQDVRYEVSIRDKDDPDAGKDLSTLYVSADYIEGFDRAEANLGHQVMSEAMAGKSIMESLTCKTCHNLDEPSVGPAYTKVAQKYSEDGNAPSHLINKIIKGGSGVWGETMMPANPDLKEADARRIVAYILSLDGVADQEPSLPARGTVSPTMGKAPAEDGVFTLSASFTDRGGEGGAKPLSGAATHYLRGGRIMMDEVSGMEGFAYMDFDQGRILITDLGEQSHFHLENIDLRGIRSIQVHLGAQRALDVGYSIEARLGSPSGELIAQMVLRNKENQGAEEGL